MRSEPQSVRRRAPGLIRADECYTLREFLRRADLGEHCWKQLRRRIPRIKIGYKVFVLGRDWINFLDSLEREPIEPSPPHSRHKKNGALAPDRLPVGEHDACSAGA